MIENSVEKPIDIVPHVSTGHKRTIQQETARQSILCKEMIEVRQISHRFGPRAVLEKVDLTIGEGEIFAIMGSSGSGKTTLLRCIAGLIEPTAGEVTVNGLSMRTQGEEARHQMGMVFQNAALFDFMSVRENVLFGPRRWFDDKAEVLEQGLAEALGRVGLEGTHDLMPSQLSGGMRKRVGIARAIALKPKVILYDEPTTGLDPVTTFSIDTLIKTLRGSLGITSVVVSHDFVSVRRIADRVGYLHEGRLDFVGTPGEFEKSQHPAIKELVDAVHANTV